VQPLYEAGQGDQEAGRPPSGTPSRTQRTRTAAATHCVTPSAPRRSLSAPAPPTPRRQPRSRTTWTASRTTPATRLRWPSTQEL